MTASTPLVQCMLTWITGVSQDCTDLLAGFNACVGVAPLPTGTVQSGTVRNCGVYYQVHKDENCWDISQLKAISLDAFFELNPGLRPNCTNLWVGNYVCTDWL